MWALTYLRAQAEGEARSAKMVGEALKNNPGYLTLRQLAGVIQYLFYSSL